MGHRERRIGRRRVGEEQLQMGSHAIRWDDNYYYAPPPLVLAAAAALSDLDPAIPFSFWGEEALAILA